MKVVHKVEVFADVRLTQAEIGALDALAGYSTKEFLDVFYQKLGKAYLQPYESGLVSLFDKVRGCANGMERKKQDAEMVLRGTHVPVPKPKTYGEAYRERQIEPTLPLDLTDLKGTSDPK